ncbi:MAG: hypothetical protein ACLGI2_09610 [Acidimicrobiia bacterium]
MPDVMSTSGGRAPRAAGRATGRAGHVSYDAALGVLTVTLGEGGHFDGDEVVEGLFTFFDSTEPGRLAKLQALLPTPLPPCWRLLLADHLGPTLARHSLALVDDRRTAGGRPATIPAAEWRALRRVQWPVLHAACRIAGQPPAPARGRAPAPPAEWEGGFLAVGRPVAAGNGGASAVATLPALVATGCGIAPSIEVEVLPGLARLTARPLRPRQPLRLRATVLSPEPWSATPVPFRPVGEVATAHVELSEPVDADATVLVHVESTSAASAVVLRAFELRLRNRSSRAAHVGMRTPVAAGTSYSWARMGGTGDRIFWRTTGKPPIEVEVRREGSTLWARGFAKRSRRRQAVRVFCVLRSEAIAALSPDGKDTVEAGTLTAEGQVDDEGFFQLKLAKVSPVKFKGELVERLELDIG